MSEQKANQDYRNPTARTYLYSPVTFAAFLSSARIPIFWGPGQYTSLYPSYSPPDPSRWRNYEHLNIPRVGRFLYGNDDDAPDDDYTDTPDAGGGGNPPPFECPGWQYEVTPLRLIRVKRSAHSDPDNPFSSGPQYLAVENPPPIGGDGSTGVYIQYVNVMSPTITTEAAWKGETGAKVKIYNTSDNSFVSESSAKECPLVIGQPYRRIVWKRICRGGGLPEAGVISIVSDAIYAMPDGDDNTQPPRCKAPFLMFDKDADKFVPVVPPAYGTEVYDAGSGIQSAKNWYGCDDPGGQRSPPPPPSTVPLPPRAP